MPTLPRSACWTTEAAGAAGPTASWDALESPGPPRKERSQPRAHLTTAGLKLLPRGRRCRTARPIRRPAEPRTAEPPVHLREAAEVDWAERKAAAEVVQRSVVAQQVAPVETPDRRTLPGPVHACQDQPSNFSILRFEPPREPSPRPKRPERLGRPAAGAFRWLERADEASRAHIRGSSNLRFSMHGRRLELQHKRAFLPARVGGQVTAISGPGDRELQSQRASRGAGRGR